MPSIQTTTGGDRLAYKRLNPYEEQFSQCVPDILDGGDMTQHIQDLQQTMRDYQAIQTNAASLRAHCGGHSEEHSARAALRQLCGDGDVFLKLVSIGVLEHHDDGSIKNPGEVLNGLNDFLTYCSESLALAISLNKESESEELSHWMRETAEGAASLRQENKMRSKHHDALHGARIASNASNATPGEPSRFVEPVSMRMKAFDSDKRAAGVKREQARKDAFKWAIITDAVDAGEAEDWNALQTKYASQLQTLGIQAATRDHALAVLQKKAADADAAFQVIDSAYTQKYGQYRPELA